MTGASWRMCPDLRAYKLWRLGCNDLMASSTWSQNAPRSAGSGNLSLASGVIYARMDFLSFAGR
jgi:hypothetical protein